MAKSSHTSLPTPGNGMPGANGIENKSAAADQTDPLEKYQDTKITGRTDPGAAVDDQRKSSSKGENNSLPLIIKKVKLVDDDYLEIEYSNEEKDHTKPAKTYSNKERPAHSDFREALNQLRVHWGLLSTFLDAGKKQKLDSFSDEDLKNFTVTGITVGGEDLPWVIITGYKSRRDKKACLVNTPKQSFTQSEDVEDYGFNRFLEDLQDDVDQVLKETRLYIGGKRDKKMEQAKMDI